MLVCPREVVDRSVRQHVAERKRIEHALVIRIVALLEEVARFAPADGLHSLDGKLVPTARVFGNDFGEWLGADRVPVERPPRTHGLAHALVEHGGDATTLARRDETIRDDPGSLAMSNEVMLAEQVDDLLERLHHETVGVDPESAVPMEQEGAHEVGAVRYVQPREVDVAVAIAQLVEALWREQSHAWRVRRDRLPARADPRGTWSLPIGPDRQAIARRLAHASVRARERSRRRRRPGKLAREMRCAGHRPDSAEECEVLAIVRIVDAAPPTA